MQCGAAVVGLTEVVQIGCSIGVNQLMYGFTMSGLTTWRKVRCVVMC